MNGAGGQNAAIVQEDIDVRLAKFEESAFSLESDLVKARTHLQSLFEEQGRILDRLQQARRNMSQWKHVYRDFEVKAVREAVKSIEDIMDRQLRRMVSAFLNVPLLVEEMNEVISQLEGAVLPDPLFSRLPDEIVAHIFSFLNHKKLAEVASVCHQWQAIANGTPALWRSITVPEKGNVNATTIAHMAAREPARIDFSVWHSEGRVKHLITREIAQLLAAHCTSLTALDLRGCRSVRDAFFMELFRDGTVSLKSANMDSCVNITDRGLQSLAEGSPGLENINLKTCDLITDAGLKSLFGHCRKLRNVVLNECTGVLGAVFEEEGFMAPDMHSFDTSFLEITDAALLGIARGCSRLRNLNLSECSRISDLGLLHLIHCTGLQQLNLYYCTQVTDAGFRVLTERCPSLVDLNVGMCGGVTDEGLENLSHCSSLRVLNLSHCHGISDLGLSTLGSACPSLQTLNLNMCMKVSDAGLFTLANRMTELRSLILEDCQKLTDTGVHALCEGCPSLEHLNLGYCSGVTDEGLRELCLCAHLRRVELYGTAVTDAGLRRLHRCRSLRHIPLYGCDVTRAGVKELKEALPKARVMF